MKYFISCVLLLLIVSQPICARANSKPIQILSPNKDIEVSVWTTPEGEIKYKIMRKGKLVLENSQLGLRTTQQDFYKLLSYKNASANKVISKSYTAIQGKRKNNTYKANEQVLTWQNAENKTIQICFQLSDEGLVFRYVLPNYSSQTDYIVEEKTSFNFLASAKGWLQPMAIAKTGWEQTNPSYEEHYQKEIPVGTPESTKTGWVYPALFESENNWVLITESGLERNHSASRLHFESPNGEYRIAMPDPRETIKDNNLYSKIENNFESPWRVIAVGDLNNIVDSDIANAVVQKPNTTIPSWVKQGKSSWSWINTKDDFIVYDEQKKYIDFAADMKWQYCLIDVNWDTKIGYEKMTELSKYAQSKNVNLLLWYNSAGDWNTVGYTPKNQLLTRESRRAEFKRLQDMGVKGVKIDFFGGDGQSVIAYYIDILEDAADFELLVNFHGATLPRSWSSIYPHLMTVEAVRGFEMVTFMQEDADRQAEISSILPFTRNVYDPMDFTPMNLSKINSQVQRRTTASFELATSILFLSGIQHYAESPEGMKAVPEIVKNLLRNLPDQWEDSRFISGYPGKDVVIARKAKDTWYVAGINGENTAKNIQLDLTPFSGKKILKIADGKEQDSFLIEDNLSNKKLTIPLQPNGGFVLMIQ
ncbi:glycoside hydrolase family 97 protein [Sphingobacterium cavernae]|uniref:glycoside hydrolase family 97 protein n=1 Tax=Sphingobacterium cavernae TaxID=2592657 RepID=UPI00122FD2ED|nr:glycoside hydrolase family 97 protein [Sphingobacterium cavernae]